MRLGLFIIGMALAQIIWAADCPSVFEDYHNSTLQQYHFEESGTCGVLFRPKNKYPIYRDYSFDNKGLLMVFNSFDEGTNFNSTGARSYFLFPRTEKVSWNWLNHNEQVQIQMGRTQVTLDSKKASLLSAKNIEFKEFEDVERSNKGGVEIASYNGVYLDTGFQFGRASYELKNRSSYFIDKNGKRCEIKNFEVFNYVYVDVNGKKILDEVNFKFAPDFSNQSDPESKLKAFLRSRCAELDLSGI